MQNELERLIARPTGRNYLRVRSQILQAVDQRPESRDLVALESEFAARRFAAMRDAMERMLPAWSLSPRFYWLGSAAAIELGDVEGAEIDRFLYQTCLRGLLATGSGTSEAPYLLTYQSDEEELLHRLGLTRQTASLVRSTYGLCDVIICEGGRELWFSLDALSSHEPNVVEDRSDQRPRIFGYPQSISTAKR